MKTRTILITPEIAKEYLLKKEKNRRIDPKLVEKFASDMREDEWRLTHQGIAFLKNGNLFDGQTRLTAIVKTGISVRMRVTRGLSRLDAAVTDQGKSRTIGDAIEIGNLSEWIESRDTALARSILNIKWSISPTMAVVMDDAMKPTLLFVKKAVKKKRKSVTAAKVLAVIALAHLNGADETRLAEFCDILVTGIPLNEDDSAVIRVRDYLMDHRLIDTRKIHVALHAFLDHKPLRYLRTSETKLYEIPERLLRFTRMTLGGSEA